MSDLFRLRQIPDNRNRAVVPRNSSEHRAAISSWIIQHQRELPHIGWENNDLPLVTSGLIDSLRTDEQTEG